MRLIDADAYAAEMKKRQDGCQWRLDNQVGNSFYTEREHWIGVFAAFVEAKITLDNMPTIGGWISVKDRMPPNDTKVMTYGNPVTHWMPLPEPPKEGNVSE